MFRPVLPTPHPVSEGPVMAGSLPVINLSEAKFECVFGRGCEGICCANGRPSLYPEDQQQIEGNLHKFYPQLRPEARAVVDKHGYINNRSEERRVGKECR